MSGTKSFLLTTHIIEIGISVHNQGSIETFHVITKIT